MLYQEKNTCLNFNSKLLINLVNLEVLIIIFSIWKNNLILMCFVCMLKELVELHLIYIGKLLNLLHSD
jgi:hypothetical protein